MHRFDRRTPARDSLDTVGVDGALALRDAAEIVARAAADEAAADQARERYRTRAMPALEPDARIAPLLGPDEHVLAVRRSAMLDRRQPPPGSDAPAGLAGDLYVTSRRLVLVGRLTLVVRPRGDRGGHALRGAAPAGHARRAGRLAGRRAAPPARVEIAAARAFARG